MVAVLHPVRVCHPSVAGFRVLLLSHQRRSRDSRAAGSGGHRRGTSREESANSIGRPGARAADRCAASGVSLCRAGTGIHHSRARRRGKGRTASQGLKLATSSPAIPCTWICCRRTRSVSTMRPAWTPRSIPSKAREPGSPRGPWRTPVCSSLSAKFNSGRTGTISRSAASPRPIARARRRNSRRRASTPRRRCPR